MLTSLIMILLALALAIEVVLVRQDLAHERRAHERGLQALPDAGGSGRVLAVLLEG